MVEVEESGQIPPKGLGTFHFRQICWVTWEECGYFERGKGTDC